MHTNVNYNPTPMDGIKQIDRGNHPGIEFAREPNPELIEIANRHQSRVIMASPVLTLEPGSLWKRFAGGN